jgi:hypothetical protein
MVQMMEEEAEYLIVIKARKKRRPNAPGTSKRKHYERPNQGKRKASDFVWDPQVQPAPSQPPRSNGRSPRIESPRPPGWKPLVLTPQLVKLTEEGKRRLADQRMKEWGKDQEEYTKREHELAEEKRLAQREQDRQEREAQQKLEEENTEEDLAECIRLDQEDWEYRAWQEADERRREAEKEKEA